MSRDYIYSGRCDSSVPNKIKNKNKNGIQRLNTTILRTIHHAGASTILLFFCLKFWIKTCFSSSSSSPKKIFFFFFFLRWRTLLCCCLMWINVTKVITYLHCGGIWSMLLGLPVQSCYHLTRNIIVNGRNSIRLMTDDQSCGCDSRGSLVRILFTFSYFLPFSYSLLFVYILSMILDIECRWD